MSPVLIRAAACLVGAGILLVIVGPSLSRRHGERLAFGGAALVMLGTALLVEQVL